MLSGSPGPCPVDLTGSTSRFLSHESPGCLHSQDVFSLAQSRGGAPRRTRFRFSSLCLAVCWLKLTSPSFFLHHLILPFWRLFLHLLFRFSVSLGVRLIRLKAHLSFRCVVCLQLQVCSTFILTPSSWTENPSPCCSEPSQTLLVIFV